jgi:hypothetical protein
MKKTVKDIDVKKKRVLISDCIGAEVVNSR